VTQQDPRTETLRRKAKADEERYCAEQDRKLLEKLQRQPAQAVGPHATAAAVPANPAPPELAATGLTEPSAPEPLSS
jgi:hypothetical protein